MTPLSGIATTNGIQQSRVVHDRQTEDQRLVDIEDRRDQSQSSDGPEPVWIYWFAARTARTKCSTTSTDGHEGPPEWLIYNVRQRYSSSSGSECSHVCAVVAHQEYIQRSGDDRIMDTEPPQNHDKNSQEDDSSNTVYQSEQRGHEDGHQFRQRSTGDAHDDLSGYTEDQEDDHNREQVSKGICQCGRNSGTRQVNVTYFFLSQGSVQLEGQDRCNQCNEQTSSSKVIKGQASVRVIVAQIRKDMVVTRIGIAGVIL